MFRTGTHSFSGLIQGNDEAKILACCCVTDEQHGKSLVIVGGQFNQPNTRLPGGGYLYIMPHSSPDEITLRLQSFITWLEIFLMGSIETPCQKILTEGIGV